jgi:hypothetical protein
MVIRSLMLLLTMTMAVACAAKPAVYKTVTVKAGNYDISESPVTVFLPTAKSTALLVRSVGSRAVVPSQVERTAGGLRVTWMASNIARGKSKPYRIEQARSVSKSSVRGVQLRKADDAVEINLDGRLFTRYVFKGAPKPYCYPIIGPTGKPVTRNYPMREVEGETKDHPHHRSFWFTFGEVNDVDFWSESAKAGKIVHKSFERMESGSVYGLLRTRNDWIAPDGKKVCEDTRELRIYHTKTGRMMDFQVTVQATDGPVTFGDTKEGMMGVRVASSMDVDRGQGHIVNSRGDRDADAWGKQAEWCDYYGPVDGKTVGITIMDHPSSFRHPTYWHVRTYGLFAANPFGLRDFKGDKTVDGSYTIPKGRHISFRYRVFIHQGSTQDADIADMYAAYANLK